MPGTILGYGIELSLMRRASGPTVVMIKCPREAKVQDIILECGAIRLVPFASSDLALVQELWRDPRASRFISTTDEFWTAEAATSFLSRSLDDQRKHGFSRWKVLSAGGVLLGWAGFAVLEETSEIELDYCFSLAAIEGDPGLPERLCRELIEWFFENTYFSHLIAVVRTDNRMVRKVMLDVGFYFRESRRMNGMPCDVFQMLSPSMQSYVLTA